MPQIRKQPPAIHRSSKFYQADVGASLRLDAQVSGPTLDLETTLLPPQPPLPAPPTSPYTALRPSRNPADPVPKGIEVEFIDLALTDASKAVARVLHGTPVADSTLDVFDHKHGRWEVKDDDDNGEIASPILRTSSDLRRMLQVIRELRNAGAATNTETGLHMHVDGKTFSPTQVVRLVALMAKYEPVIYGAFGVDFKRQELYCEPLSPHLVASLAHQQPTTEAALLGAYKQGGAPDRFFGVNLTNRVPIPDASKKCTIEFRYFNSDLDERVTEDIATMVEHICTWVLRGEDDLETFEASPEDFCNILDLEPDATLRSRITAIQGTWPLFEAMKSMPLADLEAHSKKPDVTVSAHAYRQMGRFGSEGLQLAKQADQDVSPLIRGAAEAAYADCIKSLNFQELEAFANDAVPSIRTLASFRMHTALYDLPYADALALCNSSAARQILMQRVCEDVVSPQSTQVIRQLLDDEKTLPTEHDLRSVARRNPRVRDPGMLACLWHLYSTPRISKGGRLAVLRVLLRSEPTELVQARVSALNWWERLSWVKDLRAVSKHAPETVRALFTWLTQDPLFKIQVYARGYLRDLAASEEETSAVADG